MGKLSTFEVKERNDELKLSKAFIKDVELGNIEVYDYNSENELSQLLNEEWFYHSKDDMIVGLRINGARLGWG